MKNQIIIGLFSAILATSTPTFATPAELPAVPVPDPRIERLTAFFERYRCPTPYYVTEYLNAADQNNLDYRLLPAISMQESSCGKHACGANRFGWASCKGRSFGSVAESIQYVAEQVASGRYYRGKTLEQRLRAYNPNPQYAPKIQQFMREIATQP